MALTQEVTVAAPAFECDVNLVSVCGPVRKENQDAGAAWRSEASEVALIVSDGMGGHMAGRQAAEIVVRCCLEALPSRSSLPWPVVLERAVASSHDRVLATAREKAASLGAPSPSMGATVVIAVVEAAALGPCLHVAHVGDSRAYLHRGKSLFRLTRDHSLVGRMVEEGLLGEDEAFGHPDSNVIQRAIGQSGPLAAELLRPSPLDSGDLVLLSTDGLHGAVPDDEIRRRIAEAGSAREACESLLDAALAAGSQDNVTIGCIRVVMNRQGRHPTRVEA